jgi:hypothetical protein
MKSKNYKSIWTFLGIPVVLMSMGGVVAFESPEEERYIVGFREDCTSAETDSVDSRFIGKIEKDGNIGVWMPYTSLDSSPELRNLKSKETKIATPDDAYAEWCVDFVESDYEWELSYIPEPSSSRTRHIRNGHAAWGVEKIGAPQLRTVIEPGSRRQVIIAVIDTGVDYSHPLLEGRIWVNPNEIADGIDNDGNGCVDDIHGCDFTSVVQGEDGKSGYSGDPMDHEGHGTHVSGIIAAKDDNISVFGINSNITDLNIKIMPIKVFDSALRVRTSTIQKAIDYAIEHGAHIINASWHINEKDTPQLLFNAIEKAKKQGILFVAAAGNENLDIDAPQTKRRFYPAGYFTDNIIAVTASTPTDSLVDRGVRSPNYGLNSVDLAAPGEAIVSLAPAGGYNTLTGSSMATAYVSGVAALLKIAYPEDRFTFDDIKEAIISSVDRSADLQDKVASGGRLNGIRAYNAAYQPPSLQPPIASCKVKKAGSIFLLNASHSEDTDGGTIDSYLWLISLLDSVPETNNPIFKYKAPQAGFYRATLQVVDNDGLSDETYCDFKVSGCVTAFKSYLPAPRDTISSSPTQIYPFTEGEVRFSVEGGIEHPPNVANCIESAVYAETHLASRCMWSIYKNDYMVYSETDNIDEGERCEYDFAGDAGQYTLNFSASTQAGITAKDEFKFEVLPLLPTAFVDITIANHDTRIGGGLWTGWQYSTTPSEINHDVPLNVRGYLEIGPTYQGRSAVPVGVVFFAKTGQAITLDEEREPEGWDLTEPTIPGLIRNLRPLQEEVILGKELDVSIYNGVFPFTKYTSLPDTTIWFFGFKLMDTPPDQQVLIFNQDPVVIPVK